MNDPLISDIRQKLHSSKRVLIVSHIRPDGDAVGSVLGLGLALQAVGKKHQMVLTDGVPSIFSYLKGVDQIHTRPDGNFDAIITLDCSDLVRLGEAMDGHPMPDINIDHHITNLNFARINLVDTEAVATAEILALCLPKFDLPVTKPVADALLTGIITDTIGFRTSNMTPRALRITADLMEAGADLPDLYSLALLRRSYDSARLWGVGLSKLQREGSLVWTSLTRADRQAIGYSGRDDADLINALAAITGVKIAIIFNEQNGDAVKVSWRAQPGLDVSSVALSFGGGGHQAAAGAEIQGTLEEVQEKVLAATKALLEIP